MVTFLSPLDLRVYKPNEFVILNPFKTRFDHAGTIYENTVNRGFITNLASIPPIVQDLPDFSINGLSRRPAVGHDYNYSCGGLITVLDVAKNQVVKIQLTRNDCDLMLRDGLIAEGLSIEVANLFYRGVQFGGASHWEVRKDGLNAEDFVPESYWSEA